MVSGAHISRQKYREIFQSSTAFYQPTGIASVLTDIVQHLRHSLLVGLINQSSQLRDRLLLPMATTLISARKNQIETMNTISHWCPTKLDTIRRKGIIEPIMHRFTIDSLAGFNA